MKESSEKVVESLINYFLKPILEYVDNEAPVLLEDKIKLINEVGTIISEGFNNISERLSEEITPMVEQMHALYDIEMREKR